MVEIASVLLCFISHVELYKLSMANMVLLAFFSPLNGLVRPPAR